MRFACAGEWHFKLTIPRVCIGRKGEGDFFGKLDLAPEREERLTIPTSHRISYPFMMNERRMNVVSTNVSVGQVVVGPDLRGNSTLAVGHTHTCSDVEDEKKKRSVP